MKKWLLSCTRNNSQAFYTKYLNNPRVFEGGVSAFFLDSFQGFGGEDESKELIKFGNENFLFVQIGKFPRISARVELGGAGPV